MESRVDIQQDVSSPEHSLRRRWHVPTDDAGAANLELANCSLQDKEDACNADCEEVSEAAKFAGEVKRYTKETYAKGSKSVKRKWEDYIVKLNNGGRTPDNSPARNGGEQSPGGSDNGSSGGCGLFVGILEVLFPCVSWIRSYKVREYLANDAIAGISVALMVVPQSMSYAALAGLPSEYGLYTTLLPVFMYVIFGSSRQLAVGPVAIVSLLLKEGLHKALPASLAIEDPNNPVGQDQIDTQKTYNMMAIQITFIVGLIEFGMGLIRLGFLTNFLSHSVILGFTHGGAILIGLSQVKHVVGIKPQNTNATVQSMIKAYIDAASTFDWRVLIMGIFFLAVLLTMKEVGKRSGKWKYGKWLKWLRTLGPLTASVIGIAVCYGAKLDQYGIPLVGKFNSSLPKPVFDDIFPMKNFSTEFLTTAISCAVVGLLESVSIAKRLALKNKYPLHANQELRALGIANLIGAGFSSYPATGSFSRSAVSDDTGCKTSLGGAFTGVVVLVVLVALTKPFYYMPMSALGAIVISGVIGLIDFNEALFLFRISKVDFLVWAASFFGTLFLGAELGLVIAIALAMLCVIYESAFPQVAELGRLKSTTVYRNIKQYPTAKRLKGIVILRVGSPIYFANCSYVRDMFQQFLDKSERVNGSPPEIVILEMSPVSHVDATGLHVMRDMINDFKQQGIRFMLTNPNKTVMRTLENGRVFNMIGAENIFVRVHDAVKECIGILREGDNSDVEVFFDDLSSRNLESYGTCRLKLNLESPELSPKFSPTRE